MSGLESPGIKGDMKHEENVHHEHELKAATAGYVEPGSSVYARVMNPLAGKSQAELFRDVDEFCAAHGFSDDVDTFRKGALVAQSPNAYEDIRELSDEDRMWLRLEQTNKWRQPWRLYFTIGVLSLGSAVQGWDNTGANGAVLSFPAEFGIEDRELLVGVINSALTISGLVFAWSSDFFNNLLGRRGTVFMTGLFCVFPILGQAFTHTWQEIFAVRLIIGIGLGIKITTIPIYSSEVAPAAIRGALTMTFQLFVATGIMLGFVANLIFYNIGRLAWRYQLASAFVPAVPVIILCWFCPESPRWLLKKHRFQKSFAAFCKLRNSKLQAARDLYYSWQQIQEEEKAFGNSTYFGRITDLFTVPRIRRASLAGFVIMISQQFSGINIMAFYSSTIFVNAGASTKEALLASFGFAAITVVFAVPAFYTIDTFGRRSLLLTTFPIMGICLFVVAGVYQLQDGTARLGLIATFVYIFTAFYAAGIGPCPNVIASEVFPLSHREAGGAWSIFVNNTFSTVLGLTFPLMLKKMGGSGAFAFYGGLNILATIMCFSAIPETKQRTLEELDYIFAVPTSSFIKYQSGTWLPGIFRKYVLRQNVHIPPLYNLDEIVGPKTYVTAVGH